MSDIGEAVIDRMMVKCGRRCCICRRFRPIKLQVHYIKERKDGGTNDDDNLIVTCMSCHSDIHTKVPFARRFSHAEQKMHRDSTFEAVRSGSLPATDSDDTDVAITALLQQLRILAASEAVTGGGGNPY